MKLTNDKMIFFMNETYTLRGKKLPLKLAFALKHNREEVLTKLKPFDELRDEILEKHKDDPEHADAEIVELLQEEVEVEIKTVSVNVIEQTEAVCYDKLTLGELESIGFMLEEE